MKPTRGRPPADAEQLNIPADEVAVPQGLDYVAGGPTARIYLKAIQTCIGDLDWPINFRTVVAVLELAGYRLDKNAFAYAVRRGLKKPRQVNGANAFYEPDAIRLMDWCEQQRRWLPMSYAHRHKFSVKEAQEHSAEAMKLKAWAETCRDVPLQNAIDFLMQPDLEPLVRRIAGETVKERVAALEAGN